MQADVRMRLPGIRLPLLAFVTVALTAAIPASGQTRRALLVGINEYAVDATSAAGLRKWRNLDGPVNDVDALAAILLNRGFSEVRVLKNAEATRDAILAGIEDVLVRPSQPGDVAVFFYAGHGSQIRNTASTEPDRLDETIVPVDAASGIADIRDKELRDSFNRLIDRGALVTLLFDSCHSGSITRGIPAGKTRSLGPSQLIIADPSDPPKPVDRGALILSAAQDDEPAEEFVDEDGFHRGVFTWALVRALRSAPPSEAAEDLYLRVRALVRSRGYRQEPVLAGREHRRRGPLFGDAAELSGRENPADRLAVEDVRPDGAVVLQGGIATGVRPGTELVSMSDSTLRLSVEETIGLARSTASVSAGERVPKAGEIFEIRNWVSASSTPLRLFVPPDGPDLDSMMRMSSALGDTAESAQLTWVTDPTEKAAAYVIGWTGGEWKLTRPDGISLPLGPEVDRDLVRKRVVNADASEADAIWLNLPPFPEVGDRLRSTLMAGGLAFELVHEPSDADYLLAGALREGAISYSWVNRQATVTASSSPAPPRTDWHTVAPGLLYGVAELARDLTRLDVIWGWLHLESPPDDGTFPYRFAGFENVETGELRADGDSLIGGQFYRVVLRTTEAETASARMEAMMRDVTRRYVYIFAMDQSGQGTLLYPIAAHGSVENDVNLFTDLPMEIKYGGHQPGNFLFGVGEPYGVDSFFLLTTEEALPRPDVLNFDGVRTRGAAPDHTDDTALSRLLDGIGSATRGKTSAPVPTNWSIQRLTIRSAEAQ